MKIALNGIIVKDQEKALQFYTEILGFEKAVDLPAGEYRWLTVVSADDPNGTQLALEPDAHPASVAFQSALLADGIPATAFEVDDIRSEHERLLAKGVVFTTEPTDMGGTMVAAFDDTCGNIIQIYQAP